MTPDRWLTLTVRLAEAPVEAEPHLDPVRELVPQLLLEVGGAGVEESSDTFTTYLPPPEELEGFLATVRSRLDAFAPGRGQLEWGWQPHEDWEELWRQGLGPRRITPRIVVAPTWDTPERNPGEILITLDPGMAFGTAEHATTRGCLRLLDGRVQQDDRVADIGSGSGILSIDSQLPHAPFQGIVANIQRYILVPLLPSFLASLVPGGWLILSGILLEERDELLNSASHHGFSLEQEDQEGEWWSGAFRISNPGP